MIPTLDTYILHFNVTKDYGNKSFKDFKSHLLKMSPIDQQYLQWQETDHTGYKEVRFNQFSNRRKKLIQIFEMAKINGLIEGFEVYGK